MKKDFIAGTMIAMRKAVMTIQYLLDAGRSCIEGKHRKRTASIQETIDRCMEQFTRQAVYINCAERILYSNPVTKHLYVWLVKSTFKKIAAAITKGNKDGKK